MVMMLRFLVLVIVVIEISLVTAIAFRGYRGIIPATSCLTPPYGGVIVCKDRNIPIRIDSGVYALLAY